MAPTFKHQPLFLADDKFPDVIAQLQTRGWKRFPHESFPKFDLKWSNYAKIAWPRVGSTQIVNHFHNAVVLSRKDALAARLYNGNSSDSSACGARDDVKSVDVFYPRTLDLQMGGAREKLAVWFLYGRAVAILLQATQTTIQSSLENIQQRQMTQHTLVTRTAMRFLTNVLEMDRFFTSWSQNVDLSPLDAWSDRWRLLRSHHDDHNHCEHLDECIDLSQIEAMLMRLRSLDPQLDCIYAGRGDVWICKPSNLSQGRGIHLLSDWDALSRVGSPDEETDLVDGDQAAKRRGTWIVQKYVERPLLLQNEKLKFDIRQWVLLTSLEPLKIYWYTSSYLRFCSQPFSLDDATLGDSFTHLSNYSIQKNAPSTSPAVEGEGKGTRVGDAEWEDADQSPQSTGSMWHSQQFQELLRYAFLFGYLESTTCLPKEDRDRGMAGKINISLFCVCRQAHGRDVWHDTIVPQMQHATQRAIQAALPEMTQVGRGFEWLGIDFLVDASFHVWLLEVNVSPDVSHSTAVTAQLVPEATRGVLDLVLGQDPSCSSEKTTNQWVEMPLSDF